MCLVPVLFSVQSILVWAHLERNLEALPSLCATLGFGHELSKDLRDMQFCAFPEDEIEMLQPSL